MLGLVATSGSLWTQTVELRSLNKETEITRNDLADGLRRFKHMRDEEGRLGEKTREEEDILSEQRKLDEILT